MKKYICKNFPLAFGLIIIILLFSLPKVVDAKPIPQQDTIFFIVDKMPEFPGGNSELRTFIDKNLVYPISSQKKGVQAKVYVKFIISSTGRVDNVEVIRTVSKSPKDKPENWEEEVPILEEEAMRLIKSLPRWTPGQQKGKKVAVWYTMPINFSL